MLEGLATEFPAVPEYRGYVAGTHNNLGRLLNDLGRHSEAEAAYRAALAVRAKLAADFPAVPDYRHDWAQTHHNLGLLLRRLGRQRGGGGGVP